MPLFEGRDVPSFVRAVGLHPSLEKLVLDQFSNCGDAHWRFFNTFDSLESKVRTIYSIRSFNYHFIIVLIGRHTLKL